MKVSKVLEAIKQELRKPMPEPRILNPKKEKRKMAKKAKKNGEEAAESTKKTSKKKTKAKEVEKKSAKKSKKSDDSDDGYITIAQLAEEAEINAQSARVKLRESDVDRPDGGRWRWKEGSKALKEVRKVLGL